MLIGGASLLPKWARADGGGGNVPRSPFLRPFAQDLPVPPVVQPSAPFATQRQVPPGAVFNQMRIREVQEKVHPDLPPTTLWGYQDVNQPNTRIYPGHTFVGRQGQPRVVRFQNELPANHRGFGVPNMVVHRHGGNQASEDDGFPLDLFHPGESRDFVWTDHVEDDRDVTQGTLWYHDHLIDFTAQNVYHGLAGFYIRYSDVDTGDETRPGRTGLRLPSAPFDVALLIQDRVFNFDGSLFYDLDQHDGMLGDTFLVNGAVQPVFRVKRRKYRFRLLNGANARVWSLALSNGMPFTQIGTEGGFLEFPLQRTDLLIGMAERIEFILDFTNVPQGTQITLENRLRQDDGRGPSGDFDHPDLSVRVPLLRFDVDGTAPDASVIPARLRDPFPADPFPPVNQRHFEFQRSNGAWQINGKFFDGARVDANPRLDDIEIWTFKNGGGGWWHPIHVHLSSFEILKRNGRTPPPFERAMKETVLLGPGDEVQMRMKFQNFRGRYVFHCHNVEHEDLAMMGRFDSI
jgi:FtsP/CotA-like multicopper oxidase with cupredoxin domain